MGRTGREPERSCIACRGRRPRGGLIRVVRGPAGEACFDVEARLPGRGAWVCAERSCLAALAPAALARALRAPAALPSPAERSALVARALERRVGSLLLVARKARAVVFGTTGARAALGAGRAGLVLLAPTRAPELAAWRERAGGVPVEMLPPGADLGELAGRGPAAVAVVAPGGLAEATAAAAARWREFSAESCDNKEL